MNFYLCIQKYCVCNVIVTIQFGLTCLPGYIHCIYQSPVQRGQHLKCQFGRKLENAQIFACGTNKVLLEIIGAQWLSGRVLDLRPRGRGFEPHGRHCIVVLVQDTLILAQYLFSPGRPVPV